MSGDNAFVIQSGEDLARLRALLDEAERRACDGLRTALQSPRPLARLKFDRLGCDPIDHKDEQNLAEQIDQQATHEVALQAVTMLMERHPGKTWELAPGARGSGHDIRSRDGTVGAEVFAAVDPANNDKLRKDCAKVSTFEGPHRYVIYRSPKEPKRREWTQGNVNVIALPV